MKNILSLPYQLILRFWFVLIVTLYLLGFISFTVFAIFVTWLSFLETVSLLFSRGAYDNISKLSLVLTSFFLYLTLHETKLYTGYAELSLGLSILYYSGPTFWEGAFKTTGHFMTTVHFLFIILGFLLLF